MRGGPSLKGKGGLVGFRKKRKTVGLSKKIEKLAVFRKKKSKEKHIKAN